MGMEQAALGFLLLSSNKREPMHLLTDVLQSVENGTIGDTLQAWYFYVDAPGGSGKTYLFKKLAAHLCLNGYKVS